MRTVKPLIGIDLEILSMDDTDDEFKEDAKESVVIDIRSLSIKQWADIRAIALTLLDSKEHGTDQMKVTVIAFLTWLDREDIDFVSYRDEEDVIPRHCLH